MELEQHNRTAYACRGNLLDKVFVSTILGVTENWKCLHKIMFRPFVSKFQPLEKAGRGGGEGG